MSHSDRFASLKPRDIIATIASLDERYRLAFSVIEDATDEALAKICTDNGPVLDEIATTAAVLKAATSAVQAIGEGDSPQVSASVLGLAPTPTVSAAGSPEEQLAALASEADRLVEMLKAVPKTKWGLAAFSLSLIHI